jgi:hypothetical protein
MTFDRYRSALFDSRSVHYPRLLVAREGALEVRYAPFDHVNQNAKLVILGITPGEQQADAAILEADQALRSGASDAVALSRAKAHASFSGPMRANLVAMLDVIGVNGALGIATCASLWGRDVDLVQFASALRYPVFKDGKNYTGSSPKMTASPILREHLLTYTASELASLPDALVLPLGPAVVEACLYLVREGKHDTSRIIEGVPHPSGANGERIAFFLSQKVKKVRFPRKRTQSRSKLDAKPLSRLSRICRQQFDDPITP